MALSEQIQRRLRGHMWSRDEVKYAQDYNVFLDARGMLQIRRADVPLNMLESHLAMVGELWLEACTLVERVGEQRPVYQPNLRQLRLQQVTGIRKLSQSNTTLTNVNRLRLYKCPGLRVSDLTAGVFPALNTVILSGMSDITLDAPFPPTVQTLELRMCGSVKLAEWQSVGCHLHHLEVVDCDLLLGHKTDSITQWKSLQHLKINTSIWATAETPLYKAGWGDSSLVREWLNIRCPHALITVDDKITYEPPKPEKETAIQRFARILKPPKPKTTFKQKLLEPEMQKVYKDACLKGTTNVFRGRVLLVGHMGAGKSSVKRCLLHQKFVKRHLSTDGIETEGQNFVVDVSSSVDWKIETTSRKQDWKKEIVCNLLEGMTIDDKEQAPTANSAAQNVPDSSPQQAVGGALEGKTNNQPSDVDHPPAAQRSTSLIDELREEVVEAAVKNRKMTKLARKAVFTIWDFGGQEVYYTSHQTFLSRRAIYLLVMDITKSLDDIIEVHHMEAMWVGTCKPQTARDFLEFWMKSVHTHLLLRGSEDEQTLSPPVIIVCTKKDLLSKNKAVRNKEIQDFIESVREYLKGTPYYKHVHDIIAISNCLPGESEVERLRQVIVQVATQQPYWGEERPTRWMLLADMLIQEAAVRHKESIMSVSEVLKLAEVAEVSQNEVHAFLKFHHKLGDIIYFDEVGVRDTVILSPQWLADMFSKVITQHRKTAMKNLTQQQQSQLERGMLSREVASKLREVSKPETLIHIMESFDMLIPCEVATDDGNSEQLYLVPCLLQRVPQDRLAKRDGKIPSIQFKCVPTTELEEKELDTRGFLPPGLFHRHISSCCQVKKWRHFKNHIFYDYMVFQAQGFCFALYMTNNGIKLTVFQFNGNSLNYALRLTELREEIQGLLEEILDQVFPNLSCVTFLLCEGSELEDHVPKKHGLILVPNKEDFVKPIVCPHHLSPIDLMPWGVWFGMDSSVVDITQLKPAGRQMYLIMQPHLSILLSSLSYKVRDHLVDAKLLSLDDNKAIEAECTVYAENTRMYQTLLNQVNDEDIPCVKKAVCDGLCTSSQFCPFAKEPQKPATAAQQDELRRLRPRLMESMDVPTVLAWLLQEELIDEHMRQQIKAGKTRRQQVNSLLLIISCLHSQAHDVFLEIMKTTEWWIF